MNKLILLTLLAVAAISYSQGSHGESGELRLARSPLAGRRGKTRKGGDWKKVGKGRNGKKLKKAQKLFDSCLASSMTAMKMWKDIVGNFEKQRKRMTKQIRTGDNKKTKNGVFESVYQKLLSAGGGNASALFCAGNSTGAEALQLGNLTTLLSTCQTDLEDLCNTTNWAGLADETLLQQCDASTANFKATAAGCLEMSLGGDTQSACACWEAADLSDNMEAVKTCKFPDEAKAVAKALKACTTKFGLCRKYEDDAVTSISSCLDTKSG